MTDLVPESDAYVPVVDLTPLYASNDDGRDELARLIAHACRTVGFFVIRDHRVPEGIITRMLDAVEWFFGLPLAEKLALVGDPADPLQRGYIPLPQLQGGLIEPDLHEVFIYNRFGDPGTVLPDGAEPRLRLPNRMPDSAEFGAAVRGYYRELERLAMDVMRLFARALALPESWFDDKFDNHTTGLAANYYPPPGVAARNGPLRKAAHSDWGTLTVLYQDENAGLQVLDPRGDWHDVPPRPGSFVVNIGELMTRWTNNRWSSTVHRVVSPDDAGRARYSLPFFHQPNCDAIIACIPTCTGDDHPPSHQPIPSFDYFSQKARKARIARLARR